MSKFIPKKISLDLETNSLEFYRSDFQILSLAASWYDEKGEITSVFYDTPKQMKSFLTRITTLETPLITFNTQFEMGCLTCVYPDLKFNYYCDVMRLGQLADSGGPTKEFGLKALVRRHLPEYANYEEPIKEWIRENIEGVRKGHEGQHLTKAPRDILKKYNIADTEATLRLYTIFTDEFKKLDFDWTVDHELYMSSVALVTEAKIEGIKVNRGKLQECIEGIEQEVADIDKGFRELHATQIEEVRELLRQKAQSKFKKKIVTELPEFNITSKQHLEYLFTKVLGQTAKLTTETGKPSFKSDNLGQWVGAELLVNRSKRLLVRSQSNALLKKSEYDGRWHLDLNLVATVTGRAAGGGNLNCQGLSRRDKGFMSTLEADDGYTLVSIDASSGEPSITAFYSQDARYKFATFSGVNREPFWDGDVLMIGDVYLMLASVAPYSEKEIRSAWRKSYDGRTFAEQWVVDSEVIKKDLKKIRDLSKTVALGLAYSMSAKTLKKTLDGKGYDFTLAICKATHRKYWKLFSGVKAFANKKVREWEIKGNLITEFGFILHPDSSHKILNSCIQCSLSSLIGLYGLLLKQRNPFMRFVAQIHDELIVQVPDSLLEQFKLGKQLAQDDMNKELQALGWDIPMRMGWAVGSNMYEAK